MVVASDLPLASATSVVCFGACRRWCKVCSTRLKMLAGQAQSLIRSLTPMTMMPVMRETMGDVGAPTTRHNMMMIMVR